MLACFIWCLLALQSYSNGEMSVHLRSTLARTLHTRMMEDQANRNSDHSSWYMVRNDILSDAVKPMFKQCYLDDETRHFLDNSCEKSDWLFTQIYHSLAKFVLGWFVCQTSINGLLRRGTMFVFSTNQFRALLQVDEQWRATALLDLGAGDGQVTKQMSPLFDDVYTTEMSTPMTWRLQEKGYRNMGIDDWFGDNVFYDVISCLNVIDRCDRPLTLLRHIRKSLRPNTGRAVVAMVLPYKPYVEFNSTDHLPTETLLIQGKTFEEQVNSLVKLVFEPEGFQVQTFTRLPYLCEGDLRHSYYKLDDAVFVLSAS